MPKHTKKRSTIKRKHRRMKEHAEANKKADFKVFLGKVFTSTPFIGKRKQEEEK